MDWRDELRNLTELADLANKIMPLLLELNKHWDSIIPDGSPNNKQIRELATALIAGVINQGAIITPEHAKALLGLGMYSYIMGYQRGKAISVFYVAPEEPKKS